jgi:hypothetical protein
MAQEEAPLAGDGGNCAQTLPSQKDKAPIMKDWLFKTFGAFINQLLFDANQFNL